MRARSAPLQSNSHFQVERSVARFAAIFRLFAQENPGGSEVAQLARENCFGGGWNLVSIIGDTLFQERHQTRLVSLDVWYGLTLDHLFEKELENFMQQRSAPAG